MSRRTVKFMDNSSIKRSKYIETLTDEGCNELIQIDRSKMLWSACLEQSVIDYIKYYNSNNMHYKKISKDAKIWIYNDESEEVTSFLWICDLLDLDPAYIRDIVTKRFDIYISNAERGYSYFSKITNHSCNRE